jgi:hypothetical protein
MEKSRKKKAESQGVPQALLPILGLLVTVKTSLSKQRPSTAQPKRRADKPRVVVGWLG